MVKKKIIILGAGLAGLSAAWHLQKKGIECSIFEKESEVGGLCRSKKINGFTFDYDGHLLHFKHRYTFNLIKSLLGDNLAEHQRSAWIYNHGQYSRYPFQANLYGLPPPIIKECLLGFIRVNSNGRHNKNKKNLSFFDWISQTFGKGFARHFMIPYNTKFWTISPRELTCEWLDGFIPIPTLNQILEGTIEESRRQFGYNAHFWYPKRGGINQLPLAFSNQLKNIFTSCAVSEIDLDKKEIKLFSGAREGFDYLISTLPLPELKFLIKRLPKKIHFWLDKLKWNSIFTLNLGIDKNGLLDKHWIYFPQQKFCFYRLGFYHNFSANLSPKNMHSLYVEIAYSKERPIDKNKINSRIIEDLKKTGFLKTKNKIYAEDINDIQYGYPIYDKNYTICRKEIINFLNRNDIFCCGRYGSWRYFSMEDTILDSKATTKYLLKNA